MEKRDYWRGPTEAERARAIFYAQTWLIPLSLLEPGELASGVRELAQQEFEIPFSRRRSVSEATLWRLLQLYREKGLEGLFRKPRQDVGGERVLPRRILERAIEIRQDRRGRSIRRVRSVLKEEFPHEMEQVKSSTLSHAMTAAGCPRIRRRRAGSTGPEKEIHIHMRWKRPLELVQSDECGEALWVTENGKPQKAKLIAVLDHCSKLCLHAEWFLSANLPALEKCVTQSLMAYGIFERLHVDNGAIYAGYLLKNIGSELGFAVKHCRPGYAAGKGGIERFWLTVEEDFIGEAGDSTRFTLAELNSKLRGWVHEYNKTVHSTTQEAPLERYQRLMDEPRFPDPVKLRQAAMLRERRIVDKRFCTVHVRTKEFVVDPSLRGKSVQVRYDPFVLDEVLVYDKTGTRFMQRAAPQPDDAVPAPFVPTPPAHPTPKIDVLSQLEMDRQRDLDAARPRPRQKPQGSKKPSFAPFCQEVGRLLMREGALSNAELALLKECWERYGPFESELVNHTLELLVSHAGHQLHLCEYLNALVAAHLRQVKE